MVWIDKGTLVTSDVVQHVATPHLRVAKDKNGVMHTTEGAHLLRMHIEVTRTRVSLQCYMWAGAKLKWGWGQ